MIVQRLGLRRKRFLREFILAPCGGRKILAPDTGRSDSRLASWPRRALAALRARMKLFDKRAEFRIHSPRLRRRCGVYQLLGMLIHFRAAVGTNHFGFGFGHFGSCLFQGMFSRPYRNVAAIQINSFKNLSVRLTKEASSRLPDSSKSLKTLLKLTSKKMVTNPNSRIGARQF
jgi:hypothetical protein